MALVDPRRSFFDSLATHWRDTVNETHRLQDVIVAIDPKPGMRILDLGCGTGSLCRILHQLAGEGARVVGADISLNMLREMRRRWPELEAPACQADAHALPFLPASFDVVVMFSAFAHFREPFLALRSAAQVLRPGGSLVICHPVGRQALREVHRRAGEPVRHDLLPSRNTLVKWMAQCQLVLTQYVDEPTFYLAVAGKRAERSC